MNDNYKFRFYTRTLGQDYRVFVKDGFDDKLSYTEDFEPLLKENCGCSIDSPCVLLYEENEKIYLVCLNLFRNTQDVYGRKKIYFSFCWIAPDKHSAYSGFLKIISSWSETEEKMRELLTENKDTDDKTQEKIWGKTVTFKTEEFISWLSTSAVSDGGHFNFVKKQYVPGEVFELPFDNNTAAWPPQNSIFYWEKDENNTVINYPIICLHLNS